MLKRNIACCHWAVTVTLTMADLYTFSMLFYCFTAVLGQSTIPAQLENGSGNSFNNGSIGSGDPPPDMPRTRPAVVEDEQQCDWCAGRRIDQCQTEDHPGCKCDGKCSLYGDCCSDHPLCEPALERDPVFASMECNTLYHSLYGTDYYAETYWMVARCPEQLGSLSEDFHELTSKCKFGSTAPVTDEETGIIYKNEFCAICRSITSFTRWSFTYICGEEFKDLLNMDSVPLNFLLEYCAPCRYVIPSSVYKNSTRELLPPRRCVVHVSTCLSYGQYLLNHDESFMLSEEQFENAVYHCRSDPYNAIGAVIIRQDLFAWNVYRNIHCALCNGAAIPDFNRCTQYSSLFITDLCLQDSLSFRPDSGTPRITFGLLLDINRDGATTITTTETVTSLTRLSTACHNNEVFDPSIEGCREIVCPPGYAASRGLCVVTNQGLLPPNGIAPDQTHINDISHPDSTDSENDQDQRLINPEGGSAPDAHGNEESTQTLTPVDSDITQPTAYCYLMTLRKGHDNFTMVGNDSVVYDGVTVTIVAFDDSHNPIICSMLTTDNNDSQTHVSYHQKIKQIVPGLFIAPSLLICLITVSLQLFVRKLHSVYGAVIINLALTFLFSDVFLLSTYYSSESSLDVLYFLWHTCSLTVASWLCILIVHISLAFRKSCNSQIIGLGFGQKTTLLCVYLAFGWGPVLVVALIKNEIHIEWGFCLHDSFRLLCEPMSSLTFLIVPILIAIVFCALVCVLIFIKAIKSPQPLNNKKIMYRFYVFLVLLIAFTIGWIFGFVYMLSPVPLVSAVAFFTFLSLKLASVLSFFFGLVFSRKARQVLKKSLNFGLKNKVHPTGPLTPPQIRIEEPTSIAVGDNTQGLVV